MRDILDPKNIWLGTPIGAQAAGNKQPVAVDDAVTVEQDSGPITVAVLGNDHDPEGGPLTLISAFAALGTAVAETDNTVTYTPPAGIWGTDTVVYEIADDQDQRASGQINVTITEPELTIAVSAANTLVVNAGSGAIDIAVVEPPEFAGTYQTNTASLSTGPVNLVPPWILGIAETGQVLNAHDGLWVYETGAGVPVRSWQWRRSGVDIPGGTGASYTVQAGDIGQVLTLAETMTDSLGQRTVESAPAAMAFAPTDDTALIAWYAADDTATIVASAGAVSAWADKAGGGSLVQTNTARQPVTGTRLMNGMNVLDFNGGAFIGRNITLPVSGDAAVHMALTIDGTSNQYQALLALEAVNDFQIDAGNDTQFDGRLNANGIGSPTNLSGGPFSGALILSIVLNQSGTAEAEVFIGNVSRGTMIYTAPLNAAQELYLMTNRSKNAWLDGAVAELIVTGSTDNRADFHAYLANKWGLA